MNYLFIKIVSILCFTYPLSVYVIKFGKKEKEYVALSSEMRDMLLNVRSDVNSFRTPFFISIENNFRTCFDNNLQGLMNEITSYVEYGGCAEFDKFMEVIKKSEYKKNLSKEMQISVASLCYVYGAKDTESFNSAIDNTINSLHNFVVQNEKSANEKAFIYKKLSLFMTLFFVIVFI